MAGPPLPPGFKVESRGDGFDPLEPLLGQGVEASNGFRTAQDIQRLKRDGYTPADNSDHLRGDAVDLTPGKTGWSLNRLAVEAKKAFGPDAQVSIHNGTHVHASLKGWGQAPGTPGTPRSGLPDMPEGFKLEQRGSLQGADLSPTGQFHDGDTMRLSNGRNGRLLGADAYELTQSGRRPDNSLEPLGTEARDFMAGRVSSSTPVSPTGDSSYGRSIVTLGDGSEDPARDLIRNGYGQAEPDYLRGSPQFGPYMEAERLARQNRLGGYGTNAETPSQFRHKDGPWKGAEPGTYGQGAEAVFADEPTPLQGLRPEIAKGYLSVWDDMKSTPDDLLAYAKNNGFTISPGQTRAAYAKRNKVGAGSNQISYEHLPRPLTNVGDGAPGSFIRGAADPFNVLDELGGVADTVLPFGDFDGPRENIFNSGRRFGDILANNIDQNRGILGYDSEKHPIARIGGQLASGVVLPIGASARTPFALARLGAVEGGLAGFGAGEGSPLQRAPNAVIGAGIGAATGLGLGAAVDLTPSLVRRGAELVGLNEERNAIRQRLAEVAETHYGSRGFDRPQRNGAERVIGPFEPGYEAAPILNEGAQNAGPTPAARSQPQGGVVANGSRDAAQLPSKPGESVWYRTNEHDGNGIARVSWAPGKGYEIERQSGVQYARTPDELSAHLAQLEAQPYEGTAAEALAHNRALAHGRVPERPAYAAMAMDDTGPELVGPVERQPDRIDTSKLPPMPDGFQLDPEIGRTPHMDEQASPEAIAAAVRSIGPDDVISVGPNRIESMEEAQRANPGSFEDLKAPDEFSELGVRTLTTPTGGKVRIRGPLDLTQSVRLMGGLKDDANELGHLGITNAPRRMGFGSNEQFLGKLINNEHGMSLDDATERLWEEGYFPEFRERPRPNDLLDKLHSESTGAQRFFHPHDLEEVADFHSAQAERGRIDEAEAAGPPLANERGAPATQEDMEANRAPVTAYEDLPTLGGKVANINLGKVESKEDISRLLQTTESRFGGFDASRRGKVSHAETEALATELGMRAEDLLKRRKGQALNAEQALAARRILAKSSDEVIALAGKARGGGEGDLAAFQRAMVLHAAIQEQVTGATAEAGRALGSFKVAAKSSAHRERILKAIIESSGGRDSIENVADMILEAQRDPATLNRFIAGTVKPTWKDKIVELWYNSLLSGPQTHAVNILSNALTAGLQLPEHLTAAAMGSVRSNVAKARGKSEVDRVLLSEIGPRSVGLIQGAQEGLAAFRKTLRTGEVSDHVTKVESARQEAISGLKGKIVRVPTHLLSAEDEFFKATASRMELAGLAVRYARSEGLKGEALKARIADLNANPTDKMVEHSLDYARYLTFQRPLGPAMRHVQAIVQNHPWLKLFVPFVRTPTNIFKFAIERSPAAPLLKEVRADIKAGGASRDLALARVGLGTGLGMLVAGWTADGTVTGGGPADDNAKRLMQADGWQPYSIRIGGKYYSYRRLDPLATTIGVVADAVNLQQHMTDKQREKVGALVVSAVVRNLENKVWLSTLADLHDAIQEPARKGQAFIERLAGSIAVPAIAAQTARVVDPVQRETSSESAAQGILDAVRSRIPFASKGLLPRRDMFGEPVTSEGGLGPDLASPIWTSTAKNDPVVREVMDSGASIGRLQNDVGGGRLPDKMFNDYQAVAGQLTKQYIQRQISSPDWRTLSAAQKRDAIDTAKKSARSDARGAILQMENH